MPQDLALNLSLSQLQRDAQSQICMSSNRTNILYSITSKSKLYLQMTYHVQLIHDNCRDDITQLALLQELVYQCIGLLYSANNGSCGLCVNGAKLAKMPIISFHTPESTRDSALNHESGFASYENALLLNMTATGNGIVLLQNFMILLRCCAALSHCLE